jgi:hypothetical protein
LTSDSGISAKDYCRLTLINLQRFLTPASLTDVRFALESGHSLPVLACQLSANSGHCDGGGNRLDGTIELSRAEHSFVAALFKIRCTELA